MDSSDPDILTQGQNLDIENELQESNQVDVDVCQECQSLEACSVEKSQEVTESESDSQSPNASSVDKSEVEINADECQTAQVPIVNKCEIDVDGYRPGKHTVNVRKPQQEMRTGCLAHMTIARQPNGKFRSCIKSARLQEYQVASEPIHLKEVDKRCKSVILEVLFCLCYMGGL
ncbi:hypothetical protein QQP08_014696 [Theobroma cacao]|nr:hypothetical protein QQP08_014696 [Theobroma cacao]